MYPYLNILTNRLARSMNLAALECNFPIINSSTSNDDVLVDFPGMRATEKPKINCCSFRAKEYDIDSFPLGNMALDFAATYKVLVLGDSNVGKTCIVHRFCDERYYDTYISTIGIDFKQKIINLDGVPIKLQIWDTAGQERFRTLTTAYYRGAMGILLLYDVTNLESFNNLTYWLQNIEQNASPHVTTVLAGNKCEAADRIVDVESGKKMAENFELPFYEVSCKDNINIEAAFLTLARRIREIREMKGDPFQENVKEDSSQVLKNKPEEAKSCTQC